jgi:predicted 3-demethylubiquinone-9 3-methyltransferase (glyoxalase superfamily)
MMRNSVNQKFNKRIMAINQKITINLWFDNQAEEAAKYYTSIFSKSTIKRMSHYGKEGYDIHKRPDGSVMTVEFEIEGQTFVALNGGPVFQFNEAVSLIVNCETQEEIDYYWDRLAAGGDPSSQQCGWLKDRYGISWQIVPIELTKMMADPHTEKSEHLMKAMLQMHKLNIEELKQAYEM